MSESVVLSAERCAAHLGIGRDVFIQRAKRLRMPYVILPGERVRYRLSDVDAYAERLRESLQRRRVPVAGPAELRQVERAIAAGAVNRTANGQYVVQSGKVVGVRGVPPQIASSAVRKLVDSGRAVVAPDGSVCLARQIEPATIA